MFGNCFDHEFHQSLVNESAALLERLDQAVWQRVATTLEQLGETAACELRNKAILAAHAQTSYATRKIFVPAAQLPWTLVSGGRDAIPANLDALLNCIHPIREPNAEKIQKLMRMGVL